MQTRSISFRGININYSIYGEGNPVVLIHGFGEDSSIWREQINFLQDRYQIIVPDLPGSGDSGILLGEGGREIQISDYAEAIKAILNEEKMKCVIMIGHSMGGYTALAFAEKYPESLKSLGLFHSGAYADDEEKIATRQKAITFIASHGSEAFLKTTTTGLFADPERSKTEIDLLIEKGSHFSPESLIQYYRAMILRPDRTAVLRSFPRPVLFIIGEHDKAIPAIQGLRQSHLPAISYIYILRDSAHMGMLEETAIANVILAQFLQSPI